jgi:hypothetical protein
LAPETEPCRPTLEAATELSEDAAPAICHLKLVGIDLPPPTRPALIEPLGPASRRLR